MTVLDSVLYTWLNEEIFNLNCQVEQNEVNEIYNIKTIEYDDFTEYIVYDYNIMKRVQGVEVRQKDIDKSKFQNRNNDAIDKLKEIEKKVKENKKSVSAKMDETDTQEIERTNILKSSKKLYQYAYANSRDFRTFITLTFKDNVTDINDANKKFDIWRTKFKLECKKLGIDFKYLGVPEFQKRGAVHYHILTNVPIDCKLFELQKDTTNCYDVKYWKYGFSSVFDLAQTDENFNVVKYIAKYFFKDIDNRLFGHKKILKSNNLKKPYMRYLYLYEFDNIDYISSLVSDEKFREIRTYENMTIVRVNK